MHVLRNIYHPLILLIFLWLPLFGQTKNTGYDSTMVFGTLKTPAIQQPGTREFTNSMGMDVLISTNGFGLGTFYRHEYSDDLAGFVDLSISEAKDDDEVDFINPYTLQSFVPGKINRFLLLPLLAGVQKRLFKDDILDNFRPYVNGAIGPTMIYVFPYNEEYFNALGRGHPQYTMAGYIGIGAYFGGERSTVLGLSFRYYYIPYPRGIDSFQSGKSINSKTQFGGFYISLNFGNAW